MAGRIYISGGGSAEDTKQLDKLFFNELPAGSKFLFVVTGFQGDPREQTAQQWMVDLLLMHNRPDLICQMAYDLNDIKSLADYHAVYIGGGDARLLMNEMDDSGFEKILARFNFYGGVLYGGGSGGGLIMGKYIDTSSEIKTPFRTGLDLIGRYSIRAHYEQSREDWASWPVKHGGPLLCLPSDVGVVFKDGKIETTTSHRYKIFE
jgi:Peptidase E